MTVARSCVRSRQDGGDVTALVVALNFVEFFVGYEMYRIRVEPVTASASC